MKYQFGFSDKMIKELINTFNNGLDRAKQSADETEGFKNGLGMGKYRYIYHSMLHFVPEGLVPLKLNINSWEYTVYCHENSLSMIGLISKSNFDTKRSNPPEILHYMAAKSEFFNVKQNTFENILDESQKSDLQLSLNVGENPQLEKVMNSIFEGVDFDLEKVEKFVLLVADFAHDEIVDLQAMIINENFDILYSEDWSKHIVISTQDENDMASKQDESPQHGINLNLRKNILPKKTDDERED